jgi:XTP/dITP diphosphohydrolase
MIIAATNNPGKLSEIREILGSDVVSLKDAGIVSEPVEDGETLRDNALIKAKAAYDAQVARAADSQAANEQEADRRAAIEVFPVIADDSGLFIDALGGDPGVNSARFDKPGHRREKVLRLLSDKNNRAAHFETVICYFDGEQTEYFTGRLDGVIAHENRGSGGFGYDSIFEVNGKTLAEISDKNKISHRKKALEKLKLYLENL